MGRILGVYHIRIVDPWILHHDLLEENNEKVDLLGKNNEENLHYEETCIHIENLMICCQLTMVSFKSEFSVVFFGSSKLTVSFLLCFVLTF